MAKKLLLPKDVTEWLTRRYTNQHKAWLLGEGFFHFNEVPDVYFRAQLCSRAQASA